MVKIDIENVGITFKSKKENNFQIIQELKTASMSLVKSSSPVKATLFVSIFF